MDRQRAAELPGRRREGIGEPHGLLRTLAQHGVRAVVEALHREHLPTCSDEDGLRWFYDAAATWRDGGAADLECRTCGAAAPVAGWSADDAALACLGFTFWAWDELRPEAIGWIIEATGGHRIVRGSGKV